MGHDKSSFGRTYVGHDEMTQHLTDAIVKHLPAPARNNKIYYDASQAGFGARVTANGHRSFILNYTTRGASRERRYTIGAFPNWSTVAARNEARRLRRLIDNGGDPLGQIEDERSAPNLSDLIERFADEHFPRLRPSTSQEISRADRQACAAALRPAHKGGRCRLRRH